MLDTIENVLKILYGLDYKVYNPNKREFKIIDVAPPSLESISPKILIPDKNTVHSSQVIA